MDSLPTELTGKPKGNTGLSQIHFAGWPRMKIFKGKKCRVEGLKTCAPLMDLLVDWWYSNTMLFLESQSSTSGSNHAPRDQLVVTSSTCRESGSGSRKTDWVAISFSRGSSRPRDGTCVSCIGRQILYCWATREALVSIELLKDVHQTVICIPSEGTRSPVTIVLISNCLSILIGEGLRDWSLLFLFLSVFFL